jgi:hypothetical protein
MTEQRPSKDVSIDEVLAAIRKEFMCGNIAALEIARLQRELEAANTESINRLLQAQHYAELASVEREFYERYSDPSRAAQPPGDDHGQ